MPIDNNFPSIMSKADECQLPLIFVKIFYQYHNYPRELSFAIGLKYKYRRDIHCEQLGMYNRKVFELLNTNNNNNNNNNQQLYYLMNMDTVDFPVLMIHACCINKQQNEKYFGIQNNWRNGLCTKRCANLYHNCLKNNFFFLDPYIARLHRLIYFDA